MDFKSDLKGESFLLTSGGGKFSSSRRWRIWGKSYSTQDEAHQAANHARVAVLHYAIQNRCGVDYGSHPAGVNFFTPLKTLKEMANQYDEPVVVLDDRLGIQVFETKEKSTKAMFTGGSAEFGKNIDPPIFFQSFRHYFKTCHLDSVTKELAIELYNMSHFERTLSARFLILCTCLEALINQRNKKEETVELVNDFITQVKESEIPEKDKESLIGSLSYLKKQSITQAGFTMANSLLTDKVYAGKQPGDFFKHVYKLRSILIHQGRLELEISSIYNEIDRFVADILKFQFTLA